jgi:hypothetical protein
VGLLLSGSRDIGHPLRNDVGTAEFQISYLGGRWRTALYSSGWAAATMSDWRDRRNRFLEQSLWKMKDKYRDPEAQSSRRYEAKPKT